MERVEPDLATEGAAPESVDGAGAADLETGGVSRVEKPALETAAAESVGGADASDSEASVVSRAGETATNGPAERLASAPLVRLDQDRVQRFVLGFLLAAAFFFVEAGVAEIMLARNAACVESLARMRLAPDPREHCMSEFSYHLAGSVSRAVFDAAAPQLLVWSLLGLGYGLIGGAFAQLKLRLAVAGYLILHLVLLAGFASLGYLSQFIV